MPARSESRAIRILEALGLTRLGFVGKWVLLASLIGFIAGLAAVVLDRLLHIIIEYSLQGPAGVVGEAVPGLSARSWLVLLVPTLGGLLSGWLVYRFAPEAVGHGTEKMIQAFHEKNGVVRRRVPPIKAITSALTIGTGGSAGMEGPVAQVGSGVGSAISDLFKLPDRDRRIFMLAGSSAGIGALFTAPLGGALFAPEVLYRKPEFEGEAIIPCIIASIVSYTTLKTISGESRAVPLGAEILQSLSFRDPRELPIYLVLALLCTLVSWIYVSVFYGVHDRFEKLPLKLPLRAALGGFMLGALALTIAPFAGGHGIFFGGYSLMHDSIAGQIGVGTLLALILAKILATTFAIGTGGSGGVFAPSISIGAMLGSFVGQASAQAFPELHLNPACFALVGMGGFFAGVSKTPIASMIMICEMTGGYELIAPLMLVSVVHFLLATRWTMYKTQVPGLVDSPAHTGDFVVDVLEGMKVGSVLEQAREPVRVSDRATLRQALEIVGKAIGSYFPVVDEQQKLVGIFSLSDMRRIHHVENVEDLIIVRDFMVERVATVKPSDSLTDVLRVYNERGIHEVPIVDEDDDRKVVGMLTRTTMGVAYQKRLRELQARSKAPEI